MQLETPFVNKNSVILISICHKSLADRFIFLNIRWSHYIYSYFSLRLQLWIDMREHGEEVFKHVLIMQGL